MNVKSALMVAGVSVAVIAASRRIPATRNVFIPNVGDSFFSFLPWVD